MLAEDECRHMHRVVCTCASDRIQYSLNICGLACLLLDVTIQFLVVFGAQSPVR